MCGRPIAFDLHFDSLTAMQFTGVKVVIDLVSEKMSYWFVEPCVKCNGAGIIVCPKCKGSKTLRSRPARIVVGGPWMKSGPRKMLLQHAHEVCRCWKCGRDTPADFNMCGLDNNDDRVMRRLTANFFAAQIGKPMPHLFEPTAGTVVCNTCWGKRFLRSQGWGQVNLEKFQLFDPPDHWYQVRHLQRTLTVLVIEHSSAWPACIAACFGQARNIQMKVMPWSRQCWREPSSSACYLRHTRAS